MLILSILTLILIVGIILKIKCDAESEIYSELIIGIAGFILIVCLICIPIQYWSIKSDIAEFNSVKASVEMARRNNNNVENTALQLKIIEINKWLAATKYCNTTIWDIWIPDTVDEIETIK